MQRSTFGPAPSLPPPPPPHHPGYFNDAQLGECTPCEDRWPHCTSCGLDATQSQPGIPACFGCEEGWQNDEGQPDKPCVRAPPSPPSA